MADRSVSHRRVGDLSGPPPSRIFLESRILEPQRAITSAHIPARTDGTATQNGTAGIQCFWLVESQDDVTIRAYESHEGLYAPASVMACQPMEVATPFPFLDPADLQF